MIKYSESKTIINGDTTITLGHANCVIVPPQNSVVYVNQTHDVLPYYGVLVGDINGKGVAHPQNGDSYDEITGKRVASRKAELDTKMKLLNRCVKFKKHLIECFRELDMDIMSLTDDIEHLSEELKEF